MRAGDRAGDRQAEPDAVCGVETLVGTGERLEQGRDLLGGMLGPVLAISKTALSACWTVRIPIQPSGTLCRTAFSTRLATIRSSSTRSPLGGAGSSAASTSMSALIDRCMRGVERVLGGGGEVNRFMGCRAELAGGERQERLDGGFGPLDRAVDPSRHRLQLLGRPRRLRERDLDRRSHRGQRRAQLVRGVGDEPLLAGESGIEPLEHHVEGVGQLLELVIGAGQREALTEPQLGSASARPR